MLTRQQAIIWTNDGQVYRCIYASLGLDELTLHIITEVTFSSKGCFTKKKFLLCTKLNGNIILPNHIKQVWLQQNSAQLHAVASVQINSLRPSDTIRRYRTGSTLAQVIACCLTAPSYYLNQCWQIIRKVLWHSPESNFTRHAWDTYPWHEFEN